MLSPLHPRPQLQRAAWEFLDGRWDFALDPLSYWQRPDQVRWDRSITVPFAPETCLSGIAEQGFFETCWYRRTLEIAPPCDGERVMLHFGAVDYTARVWIDGSYAGEHSGGFTPFSFDISDFLGNRSMHEIVVQAEDDPLDLAQPRGKQDWEREPHAIWYPRTTGIWQTVWLERLPVARIDSLRWTPGVDSWDIACDVVIEGERFGDLRLEVELTVPDSGS